EGPCQVVAGIDDVGDRPHLLRRPLGDGIRREGARQLPLQERVEDARDDEAQQEHADPARAQHDLAERGRELLRVELVERRGLAHSYGDTTTSTRWNSLRSE